MLQLKENSAGYTWEVCQQEAYIFPSQKGRKFSALALFPAIPIGRQRQQWLSGRRWLLGTDAQVFGTGVWGSIL